jgi:hypothetical protein
MTKTIKAESIDELIPMDKAEFMIQLMYLKYDKNSSINANIMSEELKIYQKNGYIAKYYITKEGILTYQVHKPQIGYKYKAMQHQ